MTRKLFAVFPIPVLVALCASAALLAFPQSLDALTRTNRGAFQSAVTFGTGAYTTSTFTPSNNSLLIAVVEAQGDDCPGAFSTNFADSITISGGGLTWTPRLMVEDPTLDIDECSDAFIFFTAPVQTAASMDITLDAGAFAVNHYKLNVFDYTGYNTISPVGGTASAYAHNPAGGATTITLNSAPVSSSEVLAGLVMDHDISPDVTAGTGWSQHYNNYTTYARLQTQTRTSSVSTTVQWDAADSAYTRLLGAIEIKAAPASLTKPPNNLGLVGYWSFNEGTSTKATDFSGNGNAGTLSTFGSGLPTWTSGKRGAALLFDGTNDYVNVGDISQTDNLTQLTIAAWVYLTAPPAAGSSYDVVAKYDEETGVDDAQFILGFPESLDVGLCVNNTPAGTCNAIGPGPISVGQWTHVVGVYTGTQIITYANGTAGVPEDYSGGIKATSAEQLLIGTRKTTVETWTQPLNGKIDEVRIYNRALSATEVAALYAGGTAGAARANASSVTLQNGTTLGPANGLVGHWTFDGADVTNKVYDRAGTNHGYFLGGATSSAKTIGKLGQALDFDGSDDYVRLAGTLSNYITNSEGTIAAWVRPTGTPPTEQACNLQIIASDENVAQTDGCNMSITRGIANDQGSLDRIWMTNWDGSNDVIGIPYTVGEWVHVAWVHSGGVLYAFKNGTLVTSTAAGNTADLSYLFYVGKRPGLAGSGFNGPIDDVRTYNRALTPAEVLQLYRLGAVRVSQ